MTTYNPKKEILATFTHDSATVENPQKLILEV